MVFVDELVPTQVSAGFVRWKYADYCHLFADTVEELHGFAKKLGLKKGWFQRGALPHYDLTKAKRIQAVSLGANETTTKEYFRRCKNIKNKKLLDGVGTRETAT
jgi:hypothetical protein